MGRRNASRRRYAVPTGDSCQSRPSVCRHHGAAEERFRYPAEGAAFYVGLRLGDSELGLSADADVRPGGPGRMLLSIEVPDVDPLLPKVGELGGTAPGPANDMPWGQRIAHIKDPDGNVVNLTQQLQPEP
jgi:predicted enzyme related to lactoylglutathione lyase